MRGRKKGRRDELERKGREKKGKGERGKRSLRLKQVSHFLGPPWTIVGMNMLLKSH